MSNGVVQVVDSSGEFTDTAEWFNEDANLGAEVLTIVAVLGPQASGKSTLCNSALGTSFAIAPRGAVGRATTRGIAAAKAEGVPTTLVLDIEGCDARSRGRAGKAFQARCASLATSLADVIVLNFWYHDIGRLDATGYVLLETVFAEAVRAGADGADVGSGAGDDGGAGGEPSFQSALVFAVRDVDDDVDRDHLHEMLLGDAVELWESFGASSSLEDYFSVSTFAFPHMRHRPDEFKTSCEEFGSKLSGHSSDSSLRQTKFSKGVPADSCVVFARGIWDSFSPSAARGARVHAICTGRPYNV